MRISDWSSDVCSSDLSSFCAYSASKAAVAGLTRSVAAHCRAQLYKIRCNSIHPDGIATPMVFNLHQEKSAPPAVVREKDPKQLQARFAQPQIGRGAARERGGMDGAISVASGSL